MKKTIPTMRPKMKGIYNSINLTLSAKRANSP